MASFQVRSNSFPTQSHPVVNDVEHHLNRLKASSEATSTSSSVCADLATLRDLHDSINDLIRMPSIQQALSPEQCHDSMNELLDGSLRLVDLCEFSRDIVQLTKESVQDLQSSIRRRTDDVDAYVASRKKINKMVKKCIKNLIRNSSVRNSKALSEMGKMMKEAEFLNLSVMKSVLTLLSGENKEKSNRRSWSLLSKMTQIQYEMGRENGVEDLCSLNIQKSREVVDGKNMLKQLKSSEMIIEELEQGLQDLFKSLVKTRVSLLNVLSH